MHACCSCPLLESLNTTVPVFATGLSKSAPLMNEVLMEGKKGCRVNLGDRMRHLHSPDASGCVRGGAVLQRSLFQVIEIWDPGAGCSGKSGSVLPWFDAQLLGGKLCALGPLQGGHVPAGLDLSGDGVAGLAALGLGGAAYPGVNPAVCVPSGLRVARFGRRLGGVGQRGLEAQVRWRRRGSRRLLPLTRGRRGEVKEPT